MDGKEISGEGRPKLKVTMFAPVSERRQTAKDLFNNIFVKNFPNNSYSSEDLRKLFEPFGPLISCKVDDSQEFGFVCFENHEHAAKALETLSESENGLYIAKAVKKDVRKKILRIEMLKSMRQVARQNLYFKGFPVDGSQNAEMLTDELKQYFAKFGEVKNLKLIQRREDGSTKEELLGFGYVSFHTLEAAQKCRFEASKDLFQGVHKLYVNQFEWKELRAGHRMERIDQIELSRYLKTEKTKHANEVLTAVKEDL